MSYSASPDEPGPPQLIKDWVGQLLSDKLLHAAVRLAEKSCEQVDIEVTAVLRGNNGKVCLEPRISIRR